MLRPESVPHDWSGIWWSARGSWYNPPKRSIHAVATTGGGVARRQHHPVGVEPEAQDLAHGQQAVVAAAGQLRRRKRQRRLRQAVEVAGHQPVGGEGEHPEARQVHRLDAAFAGVAAEENALRQVGLHGQRDAVDLVGGIRQPGTGGQ